MALSCERNSCDRPATYTVVWDRYARAGPTFACLHHALWWKTRQWDATIGRMT